MLQQWLETNTRHISSLSAWLLLFPHPGRTQAQNLHASSAAPAQKQPPRSRLHHQQNRHNNPYFLITAVSKAVRLRSFFFIYFFNPQPKILVRKGERERETSMREKHQSVISRTYPNWGSNLQPKYVPWPGIKPVTFWCMGWCSNQLGHQARAQVILLGRPGSAQCWVRLTIYSQLWHQCHYIYSYSKSEESVIVWILLKCK